MKRHKKERGVLSDCRIHSGEHHTTEPAFNALKRLVRRPEVKKIKIGRVQWRRARTKRVRARWTGSGKIRFFCEGNGTSQKILVISRDPETTILALDAEIMQ